MTSLERGAADPARRLRVLLLSQNAPDARGLGGVEIHVADLIAFLPASVEPFTAHLRAGRLVVESVGPQRRELAALPASDLTAALEAAALALDVDVLHVHSPQIGPDDIARATRASHVPLVVTLHDLMLTTVDASRLVAATDAFLAPSQYIRDSLAEAYPAVRERARLTSWAVPPQQRVPLSPGGPLRVAVVGVLARTKGLDRLPELMRACAGLDVEWHLFGASEGRSLSAVRRAARKVTVHGAYERSELGALLGAATIDVALLASTAPESFGMTLSECLDAAVPVVASDVGAFSERLRTEEGGWLFDVERPETLARVLERITDRSEIARLKSRLETRSPRTRRAMAAEHAALYGEVCSLAARSAEPLPAERRAAAAERFSAATPVGYPLLRRAWRGVRHSRLYRELPLRRLLPEALRAAVEKQAARLLDRLSR